MSSETHVEVKNLRFAYRSEAGPVEILHGLDFKIRRGEMVAIQGPSGSGKSTLLYLLGGLMRPTGGEVYVEGKRLEAMGSDELAHFRNERIGFVFQQFFLLPRHDVIENILLPERYAHPRDDEGGELRARELANIVDLGDRLGNSPNQLSGGQQQRVAVARALLKGAPLILADEPTGNLDTKTTLGILALFRRLNQQGKSLILITHDDKVAQACDRIIRIQDGLVVGEEKVEHPTQFAALDAAEPEPSLVPPLPAPPVKKKRAVPQLLTSTLDTMKKNLARTLLTMLGVTVGVAAILSMLTIGRYTKDRILQSYAELGVYTMVFHGWENFRLSANEKVKVYFREFRPDEDLNPLRRVFPQIRAYSPIINSFVNEVSFGGESVKDDVSLLGVNEWAEAISGRAIVSGHGISPFHVESRAAVCLIGSDIATKLFRDVDPLGQTLTLNFDEDAFGCRVIGVLEPKTSNKQWRKPNLEVAVPYTFLQNMLSNPYQKRIRDVMISVSPGTDVERFGKALQDFFEQKYGKSGEFTAGSDSTLIEQMRKFLTLFTWLLASIALVTLLVGGMGITNMMLVSVSERYKEIGLKKAVGATNGDIRLQFLVESVLICGIAGLLGIVVGFGFYEGAMWLASRFSQSITFEWLWDPFAFVLATASIFVVGVTAGLFPAMKAERLQVIEALRSE